MHMIKTQTERPLFFFCVLVGRLLCESAYVIRLNKKKQ